MKKLVLLFLGSILLVSCGGDKNKEAVETSKEAAVVKDNYSVVLSAIYEKNDSISIVYKKNGYWDYDHPIAYKVTGQPSSQKISVNIPEGDALENVQVTLSTNKEQKFLTVSSLSIFNNGKEVFNGDNLGYVKYFNANSGLTWDEKNMRNNLNFNGEYPPGLTGNEELEMKIIK